MSRASGKREPRTNRVSRPSQPVCARNQSEASRIGVIKKRAAKKNNGLLEDEVVNGSILRATPELREAFSAELYLDTLERFRDNVSADNQHGWSRHDTRDLSATRRMDARKNGTVKPPGKNGFDSGCARTDTDIDCLGERLLKAGRGSLTDRELLSMVLRQAGLRSVSDIFLNELLTRFRGFGGVIAAPAGALACIDGLGKPGAVALKLVHAGVVRLLEIEVPRAPLIRCWDQLMSYLRADMAFMDVEEVRIVYLDTSSRVVLTEGQGRGAVNNCPMDPRAVVRRAIQLNASALVVVHNHPSGEPTPSRQDVLITKDLVENASTVGIAIHDHIVLGRHGCFSFRKEGLL
nr:DNA repair protein RadC [uncultured Rhodopila sp.]